MNLLITGTGRCGTKYASKVLQEAGIDCSHEQVFGLQGWRQALKVMPEVKAESSWLAGSLLSLLPEGVRVVHLVRHPLAVISSLINNAFYTSYWAYHNYQRYYLPLLDEFDSPIEKAAYFWCQWNTFIEATTNIRCRVEDGAQALLNACGIQQKQKSSVPKDVNHREGVAYKRISFMDIPLRLQKPVKKMSDRYGYNLRSW